MPTRELTWEDLQSIPDHGYRAFELVAGTLVVSPAPSSRHQPCVGSLYALLRAACPPDLEAFVAPFDHARVTLLALRDGAYVETAVVRGADVLPVEAPVTLDLVPQDLLDE